MSASQPLEPALDLSPFFQTDRYHIERVLGQQRGRPTLLAHDQETGDPVVIKGMLFGPGFDWSDLKLFEREAQVLQQLDHPAIPQYRDFYSIKGDFGGGMALVQSYIEAPSLQSLWDQGHRFTRAEILHIARSVLKILQYLHGFHPPVIHRDIKPSNILYDAQSRPPEVFLIDFGAVQLSPSHAGSTYTVVGSYGYMPLEQFGGRPVPSSDLYGLGATLVALLSGQHPADLPQTGSRIALDQTDLATSLDPQFLNWLAWLLEPQAADRPPSAKAALSALDHPPSTGLVAPISGIPLQKPPQTQIQLQRTPESLKVRIPPQSGRGMLFFLVPFALAWNSFILFFTVMSVGMAPFPVNLVFGLFTLPFWGAGLSMVGMILFILFGTIHLSLDRSQIALVYEILGLRFHRPKPSLRQHISRISLIPRHFGKDSDGDRVEIKPKLEIWAGSKVYPVATDGLLTEPELEWLADELSRWLRMPITRNLPNPPERPSMGG